MKITPRILKDNSIDIVIKTEVSKINSGIIVAGYPEVTKRQASSHLQMKDGDTMVLAGLIETVKGKTKRGIPLLKDIPILGFLFGYNHYVERKTNILIFITPKLI
jgi:type II secretory pathway component GspD/PulD (secretin)